MTIYDAFTRVSDNQDLTGAGVAGNFFSEAIDLTVSGIGLRFRDVARGSNLALHMQVTQAFSGTATDLVTQLVTADDDGTIAFFTTNLINLSRWQNLTSFMTLNAQFVLPLATSPQHMIDLVANEPGRRYLGVVYTAVGGTFTTGRVTAHYGDWHDGPKPPKRAVGYAGP